VWASICFLVRPFVLCAEEGGAGHYTPGATASFIDALPYDPGFAYVNQFLFYGGELSGGRDLPLGSSIGVGVKAKSYADAHVLLYQSPLELLGGRYAAAVALTLARVEVDADATLTGRRGNTRSKGREDLAEGLGDLYAAPAMLVWKRGDVKYDVRLGFYAPTGEYDKDNLANIGKNYWTAEPAASVSYLGSQNGIEATAFVGVDFNTENTDTDYRTGNQAHLDLTLAQHFPLLKGFAGVGANAFYYQQFTGDSGSGATLGDFKGYTAGVGPALSYLLTINKTTLVIEAKWLPELDTENRLEGDFVWVKAAVLF
jgi:hypothetical protein